MCHLHCSCVFIISGSENKNFLPCALYRFAYSLLHRSGRPFTIVTLKVNRCERNVNNHDTWPLFYLTTVVCAFPAAPCTRLWAVG
jgi:hypothetical protein